MEKYELVRDYAELVSRVPYLKEELDGYQEPFVFFVEMKATMIGEVRLSSMDFWINNLYSLDSGKGNGRKFVRYLQGLLPQDGVIFGESTIEALPFWEKVGVRFDTTVQKNVDQTLDRREDMELETIIPFMLRKND